MTYARHWQVRNYVFEANVIALAASLPVIALAASLPGPSGVSAGGKLLVPFSTFHNFLVRENVISIFGGTPVEPTWAILAFACKNFIAESNLITPADPWPIRINAGGSVRVAGNYSPTGPLVVGEDVTNYPVDIFAYADPQQNLELATILALL